MVFELLHVPPMALADATAATLHGMFTGEADLETFRVRQAAGYKNLQPREVAEPKVHAASAAFLQERTKRG